MLRREVLIALHALISSRSVGACAQCCSQILHGLILARLRAHTDRILASGWTASRGCATLQSQCRWVFLTLELLDHTTMDTVCQSIGVMPAGSITNTNASIMTQCFVERNGIYFADPSVASKQAWLVNERATYCRSVIPSDGMTSRAPRPPLRSATVFIRRPYFTYSLIIPVTSSNELGVFRDSGSF